VRTAIVSGVVLGILYTLSPLTVISLAALAALVRRLSRDFSPRERGWFLSLVTVAIAVRLAAIALLCVFADPARPYANFFGDEELFKSRTVWMRNIGFGVPISPADMIYVYDEVGRSSFLYLLAYTQALVGDAPYGINVLNATLYVAAVSLLFAFIRRAYGSMTALAGAAFLLFVPSLFSWSIAVLKEPLYIFMAAIEIICAAQIVLAPKRWQQIAAVVGVIACAAILGSLRVGGLQLAVVGTLVGLPAGVIVTRPRLVFASLMVVPLAVALALTQPRVQARVMATVQEAGFQHWGHVYTPGYSYEVLDWRFYESGRGSVYTMTPPEAGRFVLRAFAAFVTVPRPSQIESRSALAYLPEQALWYAILVLVPFGVVAGLRRAPVVTCLLLAHGLAATGMVALTGGNIGTLIRHRGLTLPYFTWLAAFAACHALYWLHSRSSRAPLSPDRSGEHA
jgi:hypothetical protein